MTRRFTRLSLSDISNASRHKYQLDKMMTDLETALDSSDTAIAALAAAVAAQTDATTALANAATAQTTATTVKRDDAIGGGYTVPGNILSGQDAGGGAGAKVVVANHTRVYNDATSVSVTGATVTGLAYSTIYYGYYDQTSRAGGTVTYHFTTDAKTALPGASAGRHYCGTVTTPASGGGSTTGGNNPPSGGGGIGGAVVN